MSRKVISLSLPEDLLDLMDEHFMSTGYASLSEYIRELIRNDLRENSANREAFARPRGRYYRGIRTEDLTRYR
jgi:metal-responsive CopG/Arc/MetJ family transcriptional regulator